MFETINLLHLIFAKFLPKDENSTEKSGSLNQARVNSPGARSDKAANPVICGLQGHILNHF